MKISKEHLTANTCMYYIFILFRICKLLAYHSPFYLLKVTNYQKLSSFLAHPVAYMYI